MINRKELSRIYAERYGLNYYQAEDLVRNLFELLGDLLFKEGEDVTVIGFGSFKHRQFKPRTIRHPKTGELVKIEGKKSVRFTPSDAIKILK